MHPVIGKTQCKLSKIILSTSLIVFSLLCSQKCPQAAAITNYLELVDDSKPLFLLLAFLH